MAVVIQYTCIRHCFFQSRDWRPGETLKLPADSKVVVPEHFRCDDEGKLAEAIQAKKEAKGKTKPTTLSDLTKKKGPTYIEDLASEDLSDDGIADSVIAELGIELTPPPNE